MRYIRYHYENGYCGCDDVGVAAYDDGTSDYEIDCNLCDNLVVYGEEFENGAEGFDLNSGWESEEAQIRYYENLHFEWEEISESEYLEECK